MQSIQETIQHNPLSPMSSCVQQQVPSASDGEFFIEVWRQLKVAFPAWRQAFPSKTAEQSAKRVWLIALIENDITRDEQIQIGLRIARQMEIPFFPSPGQFIKWCKPTPEMLGLPDFESAYRQAITLRPHHAVVKAAIRATRYERGVLREAEFRRIFERSYDIICRRYARGEDIDEAISAAMPYKAAFRPVSREKGLEHVAMLRRKLMR
ncbi:MAG: hypothetical protein CENE_02639 [Candidatus Celerinatantimonas neptuna]|nr:MAG: hypothetical protein CENE_02639 [Candidatus Celerinatantimonas neptuna]